MEVSTEFHFWVKCSEVSTVLVELTDGSKKHMTIIQESCVHLSVSSGLTYITISFLKTNQSEPNCDHYVLILLP